MSNNTVQPYGPLLVTLTCKYDLAWSDAGSGADKDGSFWTPKSQNNGRLRPLGSVAIRSYAGANDNRATILVGDNGQRAVASPTGYSWIYDSTGTGSGSFACVWRPIAPAGYVAMGEYTSPQVWNDNGSGGEHSVGIWAVQPLRGARYDADKVPFFADTFISINHADTVPNNGLARVLLLPVPAQLSDIVPLPPVLTSHTAPTTTTSLEKEREVKLPFICLFPPTDRPSIDRIDNPFCSIQRWGSWSLSMWDDNTTSRDQDSSTSTTVGVSDSQSEEFSHSAGIKITSGAGISVGVFNASGSYELNYQFTYTSSTSRELLSSKTVTRNLKTPPGKACALWVRHFVFRSVRADGSNIGYDLPFDVNVFNHAEFPA
ncbi:hypothetical protein IAQ61_009093 [Plenodomus lingam]|uniref:uncharacterized protein n=1 Tax=Leptosphaeria maculans TaxID=5022 RepID=UPI0033188DD7|nr:hypothetical protein IAQ61_009093 [Plenodomus lingam]